jgi:class 3 adenylate cyclase/pimeloyl-ACP methyl ester carboxylesterase
VATAPKLPLVGPPDVQYARSGELSIAYQVAGEGALEFVYVPPITHLELAWESAAQARFFERLALLSRLIMLDQRGVGMSDRVPGVPTLEVRMDDIRAVMDAVGSERAVLFGLGDSGPLCVLFAATYPERTSGLVLMNSSPRFVRNPELPWLPTRAEADLSARESERHWGEPAFMNKRFLESNPSASEEEAASIARVLRVAVSPGSAAAYMRMNDDIDVCPVLPSIRAPTLVLQREDAHWDVRSSRYLASHIPGARLVELPGADFVPFLGDQEPLFAELEAFLAEASEDRQWHAEPDRVLATVLFTDIVSATARAAELGDRAWRALLENHHAKIRRQLSIFRGEEIDTAGDGFFATFDGPARAILCACAIRDALAELGLDVRAGLHAGECEVVDGKVAGIAVHTGARVAAHAGPGEVLVSSTVKDLVAGSELQFEARGTHELKGIPGEWQLYAVRDPASDRTSRDDAFEEIP